MEWYSKSNSVYNKDQEAKIESSNDLVSVDSIFFARSSHCPKNWHYDHVGFLTKNGTQIQKSSHRSTSVYISTNIYDDSFFQDQDLKIFRLPRSIQVNTKDNSDQNCGMFVSHQLQENNIIVSLNDIYSVMKNNASLSF